MEAAYGHPWSEQAYCCYNNGVDLPGGPRVRASIVMLDMVRGPFRNRQGTMNLFLAFVILLNAAALIATGYLVWNLGIIFDRKLADAIRKQDDRLRKRQGAVNGQQESAQESASGSGSSEGRSEDDQAPAKRRQIGRPYRP